MRLSGLNHITLACHDLNRSIEFYVELLGGYLKADWTDGAYIDVGGVWLCLTRQDDPVEGRSDYTHIAFSCAPDDFECFASILTNNALIWKDNTSEGDSVYFLDPDGHKLELHCGDLASRLAHYRANPGKGVRVHESS